MKRGVAVLALLASCALPPEVPEVISGWSECGIPQQLQNLSGSAVTYALIGTGEKHVVQRCTWQWYGGLAFGGFQRVRVDTILADSIRFRTP